MSDRQSIEIDYCPQCRRVWLDRGELDKFIERSGPALAPQRQSGQGDRYPRDNHHKPKLLDRHRIAVIITPFSGMDETEEVRAFRVGRMRLPGCLPGPPRNGSCSFHAHRVVGHPPRCGRDGCVDGSGVSGPLLLAYAAYSTWLVMTVSRVGG
ncbi:zf-TFIIB domain-containing protein [Sedimenticola hydrogenitrophicus]|uniref:TFIIB-type zinc ribbon-containing protein n=1 Tax=Sedimenticola hydrogenitrophicus TaxID=2967975 RepID=UPI002FF6F25B